MSTESPTLSERARELVAWLRSWEHHYQVQINARDGYRNIESEPLFLQRDLFKSRAECVGSLLAEREWRPIETAPKDGTAVLMSSGGWRTVGSWNKHRADWCVSCPSYDPYPRNERPTHWLPLPLPPPSPQGETE